MKTFVPFMYILTDKYICFQYDSLDSRKDGKLLPRPLSSKTAESNYSFITLLILKGFFLAIY